MVLSAQDMDMARTVLKNIKGDRYKDWNYLFLTPFDLNQVPGYLEEVGKPLDLQTITENLEAGSYQTLDQVWAHVRTTFENAIKYHGGRSTRWIAKMAKDMLKFFGKERKFAERKRGNSVAFPNGGDTASVASGSVGVAAAGPTTTKPPTLKIKMGKQLPMASKKAAGRRDSTVSTMSVATMDTTTSNAGGAAAAAAAAAAGAKEEDYIGPPPKKKLRLKVKLPTKKNAAEAAAATTTTTTTTAAPPPPPSADLPAVGAATTLVAKPLPPKPKIRLKLKTSASSLGAATAAGLTPVLVASAAPPTAPAAPPTAPSPAPSTTSGTGKGSKTKTLPSGSTKISVKLGNSRGKELPKGVTAPSSSTKSSSSSVAVAAAAAAAAPPPPPAATASASATAAAPALSLSLSSSNKATTAGQKRKRSKKPTTPQDATKGAPFSLATGALPPVQLQACAKILLALKRRKAKNVSWFLAPVTDKSIIQDYRSKIKYPMDIGKITIKLESKSYKTLADFCLDLRRIFSNCLCFNTSSKDPLRPVAMDLVETSEDLMAFFFAQVGVTQYPKLFYCWKLCMEVLGTLYNMTNPEDGQPTVLYFLYPVKYYCGGQFPPDYLEKVKKPMDFQTITSDLIEGRCQSVADFAADCRLIVQNCNTYYSGRDDGKLYLDQANRLATVMNQQLEQLLRYDKSPKGAADRAKANTISLTILRPPPPVLLSVLEDLRALTYTDKATKITEPAMAPFEKPVSTTIFPDYMQHITDPIDLQTVERKVNAGSYTSPEDFEFDMNLTFRNCEKYHSQRNGEHLVSMAKFAAKHFRRLFVAKMKAFDDPSPAPPPKPDASTSNSSAAGPPHKKQKMDAAAAAAAATSKSKNAAPRISIAMSSVTAAREKTKSPKPPQGAAPKKSSTTPTPPKPAPPPAPKPAPPPAPKPAPPPAPKPAPPPPPPPPVTNQPVPLHIAIARVKEAFPLRRAVKSLVGWEADSARYFKELLRHPWLSAARPKFIFHVPVTMLFPELRDAYAAKIRKPMDLTTVECTLLAGGRYLSCEDLIEDVALTFSNAIRFNKDGRDIGDPLSCAYYDASVHLLRYARWLSLELLSEYVEDSDHVDDVGPDGLPPLIWKLTKKNREIAQKEMMDIVLKEPIEKSLEGDRNTWYETECEKLLKALRHQGDSKKMSFFIRADYPPDYTTFIAKPMDWEKVQKNLKKRLYDNFGQIIEDLRLIFKNAFRYNGRLKDRTDTESGQAYAAAEYMSVKLENAIRKLMLSVGDRVERERIDHANAEREIDAEQKAEEARIRAAWKKDPDNKDGTSPMPGAAGRDAVDGRNNGLGQKVRLTRRPVVRKETTDFEIPYFADEHDTQHEKAFVDYIKMQKSMFEKQRQELVKMRGTALAVGGVVYTRLWQRTLARRWLEENLQNATRSDEALVVASSKNTAPVKHKEADGDGEEEGKSNTCQPASLPVPELNRSGQNQIKIFFFVIVVIVIIIIIKLCLNVQGLDFQLIVFRLSDCAWPLARGHSRLYYQSLFVSGADNSIWDMVVSTT